uniref:Uncharacterized protein n=1 Tax=Avena sativa TaxID=4498 RepID=A0ACD5WN32_AVESA
MEDNTQPPPPLPQQPEETELAGDKRKREESPEKPTLDEAAAASPAASTVEEVAAPAGDKRRREDSPEKPTGDEAQAASPAASAVEEASAPAVEEAAAPDGSARQLHPMSKTSLCSFFRRRGGGPDGCSHGEGCRYAHTEEELRPRPDGTWDPTSDRAKKLRKVSEEETEEEVTFDEESLDKCLVGLSRHWVNDRLKSFLQEQGISYAVAKKKKGMTVGFVTFESIEQLKNAVEVLKENRSGGKEIKIVDANRRSHQKLHTEGPASGNGVATENSSVAAAPADGTSGPEAAVANKRTVRDAVTPLAHMTYKDQLEHKKNSVAQLLKKLTRNAKKACPDGVLLPEWISASKQIAMDSSSEKNDNGESQQLGDKSADPPTCSSHEINGDLGDRVSKELEGGHDQCNVAVGNQNSEEASPLINEESIATKSADSLEHTKTPEDGSSISNKDTLAATACQFKNFVAIVDPPRAGLHPTVIKVLRTHPRIRRLVYISCNPDTLMANAIELCTPTSENREKNKGHRGWRNMSSAGLARQRTKSMPMSEPFVPKRAMAVDLFPHTSHCEMVMLFER